MKESNQGVTADPVLLLAVLYFSANLYSFVTLIFGGEIFIDSLTRGFDKQIVYLTGLTLLFAFALLLVVYRTCIKFCIAGKELLFLNSWGWSLALLQSIFLLNNIYYGVNLAGVEDPDSGSSFKLLFNVVQPDLLYLIIGVGLKSSRLFWLNTIIFAFSLLVRGWIGGFFIILILYLCRNYPIQIRWKYVFWISLSSTICALIFPFLVEVKWFLRADGSLGDAFNSIMDRGYFISLNDSLAYLANRFQMFGHVALIVENSEEVATAYSNNEFIPYWADGPLQWVILKISNVQIFQLNRYMVLNFFGSENLAYSTNPGIAGWIAFLQEKSLFFIVFIVAMTFFPARFAFRYAGHTYFLVIYSFVLVYLFHGWIGAYFNLLFYMLVFLLINKLLLWKNS